MRKKKRILGERKASTATESTSAGASTSGGSSFQGSLTAELTAIYRQACERPRKLRRAAFLSLKNKMDQMRSLDDRRGRLNSLVNNQRLLQNPTTELLVDMMISRLREICVEVLGLLRFLQNSRGFPICKVTKLKVRRLSKRLAVKKKPRKELVKEKVFGLKAYVRFLLWDAHKYFEDLKTMPYFKIQNVLDYAIWRVLANYFNYDGDVRFDGVQDSVIRKAYKEAVKGKALKKAGKH